MEIAAIAVPLNTAFGILTAMVLVRGRFRGKWALDALIDLPFAISPVVIGLSLLLLYGREGWIDLPFRVVFAVPGMVLATVFVSLPFVVREVAPVLREVGDEQEQAAATLGAGPWQTFWRITLPVDPVRRRLRRRADDGAGDRRVRRRERRLRQGVGRDGDADAARREPLPELRPGRGLRGLGAARRHRAGDAAGDDAAQAAEGDLVIRVQGATKRYGDFAALDDVSVDVPDRSLTALLGPSGSGKSTLLRVIAGLEQPDAGRIELDGDDVTQVPPQRRGIGFVFQHYAAFKHMTVRDNVAFGLTIRKRPRAEVDARVDELLGVVGLSGFHARYPSQLSGGQRQRMALARALAVEPRLLLLDEPFGALDANVRAELRSWLRRLHEEVPVTTVLVTHDQEEAMEVADRVVVMNGGRVEQVGAPREVYDAPANEFVMGFLGPVARLQGSLVRPHDVGVTTDPEPGAQEAQVLRVVHLGFEVRLELELGDGSRLAGPARPPRGRGARGGRGRHRRGSAARGPWSRRPSGAGVRRAPDRSCGGASALRPSDSGLGRANR